MKSSTIEYYIWDESKYTSAYSKDVLSWWEKTDVLYETPHYDNIYERKTEDFIIMAASLLE